MFSTCPLSHGMMEMNKVAPSPWRFTKLITYLSLFFTLLLLLHTQSSSPFNAPSSLHLFKKRTALDEPTNYVAKLRDSVTFLPLKDLRFSATPMDGNTWFMSSINDTHHPNETQHLYFPSQASKGRLLCLKGRNARDGASNLYALAYRESLPEAATLLQGLTFVSDTFYDYANIWHGLFATAPFAGWSMKNGCAKPARWVLYHMGELRGGMGSWVRNVTRSTFGEVRIENFGSGDGDRPYCFEKAVVMRHNLGKIGKERKREVSSLLRCKTRQFCGIKPNARGNEVNEQGDPIIRFTLLSRRGPRSFKNETAVTEIFAKECAKVEGCVLKVAQSEDLNFCDQVRVLTYTDIVASPHGAQLTNMLFMDPSSSVMEFFPRGWHELAGVGQHAHRWTADLSGLKHEGAWWEPLGEKDCPNPQSDKECFHFYKQGKVGHNETYFAEWARTVLAGVRLRKLQGVKNSAASGPLPEPATCAC